MNKTLFVLLQASIQSDINQFLTQYAVPMIAMFIVVGAGIGFVMNFDKIIDRDGNGTRKEGIINLLWVIAYVFIGITIVGAVVMLIASKFDLSV